jgi:adenylosuccinate synthase
MERIPVCTRYILNGEETDRFPFPSELEKAEPVIEYLPGWNCDISGARSWDELPKAAKDYVLFIERSLACPIIYVSVGPERESIIRR